MIRKYKQEPQKMKLILAWICLICVAAAFPTDSPPKPDEENPCCVGPPKLLFQGYASKHNINVYLFEFPPLRKQPKEKMEDENEQKTQKVSGGTEVPQDSVTGKYPGHEETETNTPAYPQHTDMDSDTLSTPETSNVQLNTEPSGITGKRQKYEPNDFPNGAPSTPAQNEHDIKNGADKSNISLRNEVKDTHIRNIQKYNRYSSTVGYSNTGGTTTDSPRYDITKVAKQDSNEHLSSQEDFPNCPKTDGSCKISSEHSKDTQANLPAYRKVDSIYTQDNNNHSDTVRKFINGSWIKNGNLRVDSIDLVAPSPNKTKYDTKRGQHSVTPDKLHGQYGKVKNPDITLRDQAKNTHREELNDLEATEGYYSTDGITLIDIPDYTDRKEPKQDPNVQFPSKDIDILKCTKTGGLCVNDSDASTHKKESKDPNEQVNVALTVKNQTNKSTGKQQKIVTAPEHKSNNQPGPPTKDSNRVSPKYSISRDTRQGSKTRRRYNSDRLLQQRHNRRSSSESTSDSSQESD